MDRISILEIISNYIKSNSSAHKRVRSLEVIQHLNSHCSNLNIEAPRDYIIRQLLGELASSGTGFKSIVGKKAGYWFDPVIDISSGTPEITRNTDGDKIKDETQVNTGHGSFRFSEGDLYPLVQAWLSSKGYSSFDVSNARGGKFWGNPDIMGFHISEVLGCKELEVVSCEVKLNDVSWRKFIFEAVSHQRFSDKAWFIFRVSEDQDSADMMAYADRFGVGIAQIVLDDTELEKLAQNKNDVQDLIDNIVELNQPHNGRVPLKNKAVTIENLGAIVRNQIHI